MSHAHSHSHGGGTTGRRLVWSVALTLAFVTGEAVIGYFANSLALISDAGHNLADAGTLGLSAFALWLGRRRADARRTYGYHRAGILAALANAVSLVVIALVIFWEAAQRLRSPEPVQGGVVIGVALAAVAFNGFLAFWLRSGARHDLNVRGAYLHQLGDTASAVGVVVAGVLTVLAGSAIADPVVSLLIGALILYSSWDLLRESVDVLLEAAPRGLDMAALERAVKEVPGVLGIHDLHVWTVTSGIVACSCHVLVAEQTVRAGQQVLRAIVATLRERFGITHTTIQVEVEGCEPDDLYCTLRHSEGVPHDHGEDGPAA